MNLVSGDDVGWMWDLSFRIFVSELGDSESDLGSILWIFFRPNIID
jgi:hypothetical protein